MFEKIPKGAIQDYSRIKARIMFGDGLAEYWHQKVTVPMFEKWVDKSIKDGVLSEPTIKNKEQSK